MQPPRKSRTKLVLLLVLIPVGVVILGCSGVMIYFMAGPEGGVRTGTNMEKYATQYIRTHQLLNDGEQVQAYYDVTIDLDSTECYIVTPQRVIHHVNGQTVSIPLKEVVSIDHNEDFGDVILITSSSGSPMKLEIAPLNDGKTFLQILRRQWELAKVS